MLCQLLLITWLRFDQGFYAAESSRSVKVLNEKPFATVEIPPESVSPLLAPPRGKMANCVLSAC